MSTASRTRGWRWLPWLGLLLFFNTHCVIDPMLLFPPQETTTPVADGGGTSDKSDKLDTCYEQCIAKGTSANVCKENCATKDPTIDCYQPCIKGGSDSRVCRKKCYGSTDPVTDCLLSCVKSGLNYKVCEPRSKTFEECLQKGGDVSECSSVCKLNSLAICYNPCLKEGTSQELCKKRTTSFTSCLQAGKSEKDCSNLCLNKEP